MARANRLIKAAAVSLLALAPLAASAAPSPSPSLDTVLATPPSGYAELTSSPLNGLFTAHDYAQASGSTKPDQIESTLNRDGFVSGFGKTWLHQASAHALVEAVLAFTGAKGAKDWLVSAEAGDKSDPTYAHADAISGISPYYGGHFKHPASATERSTEGDLFSFVKGNDVFIVGAVSTKDDVLQLAMTQTQTQYSSAPKETIPSAQWPENAKKAGGFQLGYVIGGLIPTVLVVALVIVVVGVVRNRSRARTSAAGAASGLAGAVQMSNDGNYWWDGQTWRDASKEVPPSAQRSGDGALWWDGQTWRPVPQAGEPANPTPPPTA